MQVLSCFLFIIHIQANNQSRWLEQYQMHIHLESIPVRDATQMVHLQIAIAVNGHAPSQWGGKEDL